MTFLLAPFSWIFGILVKLRSFCYEVGIFKSTKLDKPVISVGNITVGGTGKTPFVDRLISQFEAKNLKVGVLTRGFGRKFHEIVEVLPDTDVNQSGDEPLWLKRRHPQAQIIVGANRVLAAQKLKNVDVIILDDGMQHLKIKRDLEVSLLDSTKTKSHYHLLPWGRAREKITALQRSDFVVLTKTNLAKQETLDHLVDQVFGCGILDIIESETVFKECADLFTGEAVSISGKKVFLASGIANPMSFEQTVKSQNAEIIGHKILPDHTEVDLNLIQEIEGLAGKADAILTTEKDAIKWKQVLSKEISKPIYIVKTQMIFHPELPSFYDLVSHIHY